jgi:hypothetical protein
LFREPVLCAKDDWDCLSISGFGDRRHTSGNQIHNFQERYNDEPVKLFATKVPAEYSWVFGTVVRFALAFPGAVLSSFYIPGDKFPLVLVAFVLLGLSVAPLQYIMKSYAIDENGRNACEVELDPVDICSSFFSISDNDKAFMNCVGRLVVGMDESLCVPPAASILPQFGAFQTLNMALIGRVQFYSEPENYF